MFKSINSEDISFFETVVGERCFVDAVSLERYSKDETEDISILPNVVLKPESPEEISKILSYCNAQSICVTPSGARTGLSGGAIPVHQGVALSMEKFNKILEIDENNHQVTTEPGVITQVLQEAVKTKGLFYPPDPASKGSCFIGGNVSENSGGPKAVKYGVTNEYVL
ncbi:MAG: glycolate oxidase, partial [Crocinitomicaceae bacterium]